MKHIILVFMSLLSAVWCNAQERADFQSDDLLYALNGSEVTVVGQTETGEKMAEVTIPETVTYNSQTYIVTKIGGYSFANNQNLVKLTMGDGVVEILCNAFYNCRNLKRITLSKTLEVIDDHAFNGCVNLDSLVLPATMKTFGVSCFGHCSRLKDIFCLSEKSPEFTSIAGFTSYGYLHVPKGCKQAYDDYLYWLWLYDVIDDIDLEDFESDNKDDNNSDKEPNKDGDSEKDNGSNKEDDSNKNNESSNGGDLNKDNESGQNTDSDNTETTGDSDSTEKTDPDKDEEQGTSTAIREFTTTQSQTVFSLIGIRLDAPVKGINIINGKKVFVK